MSSSLNKLFEKGKAKVKEYSGQHSSHQQGYPGQGQGLGYNQGYNQGYDQQPQYGNNYPPPQGVPANSYPYPNYNGPPPQNQQWGPPQQQWGPPQQQWNPPPPHQQQPFSAPPIPQHSKPHSPAPPPIPQNRPTSNPPPPQTLPPASAEKAYWKPSFNDAVPVTANFRHELGAHGWGNNEKQDYTAAPANSFHHSDRLIVRALAQNGNYTSARLTSHQTLSRARGFLSVTILAPCAEGVWPAFWMLPQDPFQWPGDGEVDIFESWMGDCVNHSCLHWGHYNGEDWDKHKVVKTQLHDMASQPHVFGFAWCEEEGVPGWRGRMVWYVDGRPVMKASIPMGTRRMEEFRLLINVAMGGNICKGALPKDGYYDLVVSELKMCEEPVGGWTQFESDWAGAPEGRPE